ncbi:hypothetical protein CJP70_00005 [Brucella abortus]|nr:hypothetical protein CJP70_00005 [Brucella abortus]
MTSARTMARTNVKAGETMAMMTGKSTATIGDNAHANRIHGSSATGNDKSLTAGRTRMNPCVPQAYRLLPSLPWFQR